VGGWDACSAPGAVDFVWSPLMLLVAANRSYTEMTRREADASQGSSNYTLGARLVQQESGKVVEKKTGLLGSGSFGISRSRRRSDLGRWCSASISA
jgi:hypothetical protein